MKIISLWQPWASLMAAGIKRNETRSWSTSYRGDVVIHAAQHCDACATERIWHQLGRTGKPDRLPAGQALCVVRLIDVCTTDEVARLQSFQEAICGDYGPGRYVWRTEQLRTFRETPLVRGAQGLRDVPPELQARIDELLRDLILVLP
jgi:hypothetical protein